MKKNNKKGFTLVELVIVVAVMAILVAVAIPTIGSVTGKAKMSVYNSNAKTIESMLKLAQADADTGDATITVDYKTVLEDAKLGIKAASDGDSYAKFYFNPTTMTVSVAEKGASGAMTLPTAKEGDKTITFGTDGKVTVS